MAITKLEKNKVYADGLELGYAGTANPKKVRVRFFPQSITTHNHQTNVTQKQTLATPILVAQMLHAAAAWTDRSIWAPHPKEWWATEQLEGGVVYSPAHTADEVAYFANNAKFGEINWRSADGTPNQDPRHFGNATTKKEGEEPVAGLFFMINDTGTILRVDKDGKPLNPDGTYVNAADDPATKKATDKELASENETSTETLTDKVKKWARWALYAGLGVGAVFLVAIGVKKASKTAKKGK